MNYIGGKEELGILETNSYFIMHIWLEEVR